MLTANTIWSLLFLIVLFLGIVAGGYYLCLRLLRTPRGEKYAVILPLRGRVCAAERLYAQYLRIRILGEGQQGTVIALDLGLSGQQRDACERFCRCTENMEYCTPETLPALLEKLQKET